jgi:hypothetical protein
MTEVKTHRDHPSSMEERIQKRRRNSGDAAHADYVVHGDKGTISNVHYSRNTSYGEHNRVRALRPDRWYVYAAISTAGDGRGSP